jgi:hypothetical protein
VGQGMKLGKYEYYKYGHQYHVIGVGLDTVHKEGEVKRDGEVVSHMETVIYKALYPIDDLKEQFGLYPYFTRTMESFTSQVEDEGEMKPMFRYVGPMD